MDKIRSYVIESFDELKTKMTWPTWTNLQSTTGVVLLAIVFLTIIIFGMDFVSNQLLKFIYKVN